MEEDMAKGQLRSNREKKKPKADKNESKTSNSPLKNVESSAFFVFLSSNSWGDRVVVSAVG